MAVLIVVSEGVEQVLACQQQAVALPLVAVGGLEGQPHLLQPVLVGELPAVHEPQLSVEHPHPLADGDGLARGGVVAGCEEGCLAAGQFQAADADVDVYVVHHLLHHPCGREHLGHVLRAVGLLGLCLEHTGPYHHPVLARYQPWQHLGMVIIRRPKRLIVVRRPEDMLARGMVVQQCAEHRCRQCQQVVLPDVYAGRGLVVVWHSCAYSFRTTSTYRNPLGLFYHQDLYTR